MFCLFYYSKVVFAVAFLYMECIVSNKYLLGKQIGKGSFGDIYLGTDITTSKSKGTRFI